MSIVIPMFPEQSGANETRLNAFGLSTPLFHSVFRPGLNRARNRSGLALASSKANDLYHDTNEQLRLALAPAGWKSILWNHQPRLVHPDGLMAIIISSATGVGSTRPRTMPITGRKGPATLESIARTATPKHSLLQLLEFEESAEDTVVLAEAPLWMALHELTEHGLNLELSKPRDFRNDGSVDDWSEQIPIDSIRLDGDFSAFKTDDGDDEFDVAVDPR
jgi:hypothetical protein